MKVAVFSAKPYDREFLDRENLNYGFQLEYFDTHLGPHILKAIPEDCQGICAFVNDNLNREVLSYLAGRGIRKIALRCAGFNNLDMEAARELGMQVTRVPAYSPEAVAEHALALILTLNRKTHKAYNRVREQNFSLNGLLGYNLHGKTVGVLGTGKIGMAFCRIMAGLGCEVLAYDPYPREDFSIGRYVSPEELWKKSDIISLHLPLTDASHYLINEKTLSQMKDGVTLINTSRGGLLCTKDVIEALKDGKIGLLGLDVYEQESAFFFRDLSGSIITDDQLQRLLSFPNVLITGHQAFFTAEALGEIAASTLYSLDAMRRGDLPDAQVIVV